MSSLIFIHSGSDDDNNDDTFTTIITTTTLYFKSLMMINNKKKNVQKSGMETSYVRGTCVKSCCGMACMADDRQINYSFQRFLADTDRQDDVMKSG